MNETFNDQDLQKLVASVNLAEAGNRAAIKEIWDARTRQKQTEVCLALVLGALTGLKGDAADYTLQRLSQQLRYFSEVPSAASGLVGCSDEDVNTGALRRFASQLAGEAFDQTGPTALAGALADTPSMH